MEYMNIEKDVLKKLNDSLINKELTLEILEKNNNGDYDNVKAVWEKDFPPIDNKTIIDMTGKIDFSTSRDKLTELFNKYNIDLNPDIYTKTGKNTIKLSKENLEEIGKKIMPLYSFGILNGGSATSYADSKKNKSFNKDLFNLLHDSFSVLSKISTGKAKGITPAFTNPDGTPGPSFIELKMRALLIQNSSSLFQMTSHNNNNSIMQTYKLYKESPYLKDLIAFRKIDICNVKTGIQPLLSAYTHSSKGKEKTLFIDKTGNLLPLPGGHGQCFITLKDIFRELHKEGIRFISIGNVDNTGYTPDPKSLALLALSEKQAAFDFAFKTPVDIKGGILVTDDNDKLNCADIGVAISKESVMEGEKKGRPILFNCATGLFNLEYLVDNIDNIINSLPMRISDQDKDAGIYSQAEQVTWEVIGLLDNILIFAIDKYDRFLAAKTIMENLMTSGIKIDSSEYPTSSIKSEDLKGIALKLSRGLEKKLKSVYGLKLVNGRWIPLSPEELEINNENT